MPAPPIRSVLFGKLAVGTRFITEEQLQECLAAQKEIEARGGTPPKLGEILEEKGYLTAVQIRIILESMAQQQKRRFGEIALAFQFLKQSQVNASIEMQLLLEAGPEQEEIALVGQPLVVFRRFFAQKQSGQNRPRLGEILLALGHLRQHQVEAVLDEQGKKVRSCGGCQASLNITKFRPGQKIRCAQCGAVLEVVQLESGDIDVQLPPMSGIWDAEAVKEAARGPAPDDMNVDLEVHQRRPSSQSRGPLPSKLGDFKVLQLLGEDATGRMLKAQQVSRDRVVALKVMRRAVMAEESFRDRFLDETKKAATLDHPNLRKLYSVAKIGDRYCVAMEFVEGDSVFGVLQKQGPFHFDEAVKFIRPVLQALGYAHRNGVVHGDVRPSNVMIAPDGTVKLAGFGLSPRVTDNILAISDSGKLAPFYVAPECVTADRVTDHRIDIYSVGATLFHMISGKPPYQGKSPFEVLVRLSMEQIPPLRFFDPTIPELLNSIVHRMLDPEPEARYMSCEQVLADLDKVEASPGGSPGTAAGAKGGPKNRALLGAGIAAAVLAAVALGWNFYSASERASAWQAVLGRAGSLRKSRGDFESARGELERFAAANPGTAEAGQAVKEIEAIRVRAESAAAEEFLALQHDVAQLVAAGRYGEAIARLGRAQFQAPGDPRVAAAREEVEQQGSRTWETVAAAAVKLAEDGKPGPAEAGVAAALASRELFSDTPRAVELRKRLAGIKSDLAEKAKEAAARVAKREAEERRVKEEAADREAWAKAVASWEKNFAAFDQMAAWKALEVPEVERLKLYDEQKRLSSLVGGLANAKTAAISSITGAQNSWDGKPENDRRIKARLNGVDYRAKAADEIAITFAAPGGADLQTVLWKALEPPVAAEALRRGAEAARAPAQYASIAAWCIVRSAGTDTVLERWLMEEAERRLADAETGGAKDGLAPLQAGVNSWAERAQQNAFTRLKELTANSKFQEAALEGLAFRNSFGRRKWTQDHAVDLDQLELSGLMAATPEDRCTRADFASGPGAFEISDGWKAAGGVLVGNGKEESVKCAAVGIAEIAFLVRFAKPDFRLTVTAGEADLRLEPSRPRFDLIVRREGATPLQKALKDKGDELRLRDWHLVQIRFDGANAGVVLDGEDEGSIAMASRPDGFTLTLSGVSQTQAGAADLDCLMVKRK
ncbi:MAG: serine/threonine protein kinase [Planctomycetota bacterium]|nr:MAG: serine/threonine protein kinase [Planctomycetota bacterium]